MKKSNNKPFGIMTGTIVLPNTPRKPVGRRSRGAAPSTIPNTRACRVVAPKRRRGQPGIEDQFTDLPISRQRKWQLRQRAAGKCIKCDRALFTARYCKRHAKQDRDRQTLRNAATRAGKLKSIRHL